MRMRSRDRELIVLTKSFVELEISTSLKKNNNDKIVFVIVKL